MSDMDDMGEVWREVRRDRQANRAARRPARQAEIRVLESCGFRVVELSEYHFRIDEALDLYPTNRRYHNLATGRRGHYTDALAIAVRLLRGGRT